MQTMYFSSRTKGTTPSSTYERRNSNDRGHFSIAFSYFLVVAVFALSLWSLRHERASRRRKTTELDITSDRTLYRSTDFAPARKALATETVLFTGGAAFDEDGVPYRTFPEGSVQYVGPPTAEIDSAWEYLLSGRYFIITEQEAKEAFGSRYKDYYVEKDFYTGYMVGLDLFHVLHCTNMLRKLLDPEYYFPQGTNREWERYHVDHCIDMIRQTVMCHGSLTPIPWKWFESANRTFTDSDQYHECRNFEMIREWSTSRFNGSEAVQKRKYNGIF